MQFAFQLEPDALIAAFAANPPHGFALLSDPRVAASEPPVFHAPFDLLTTADESLKERLASLPLFRHWSYCLCIHTAFVGTTVSEYALWPHRGDLAEVFGAVLRRCVPHFKLLIVKDIPHTSPLLSATDNVRAEALAQVCREADCFLIEGQALAYVVIDFASLDAYLMRLSASRRHNLRRKLRSRTELEIRRLPTGSDIYLDDALIDAYYALYEAVYAQSELHFDHLTRSFFSTILRDGRCDGLVFEYRQAGRLIGWNLCFEVGGKLIDKYVGLLYPQARARNLYFVSWMVNLEYAIERGLTHYVAGWTDPEVKSQLGARFTFTRHAVYVRNPLLRQLARRLARHFESDRTRMEGLA